MPSLDKRMTKLEETVEKHLVESGEIRADLRWLRRAIWFVFTSPFLVEALRYFHSAGK